MSPRNVMTSKLLVAKQHTVVIRESNSTGIGIYGDKLCYREYSKMTFRLRESILIPYLVFMCFMMYSITTKLYDKHYKDRIRNILLTSVNKSVMI